MKLYGRFSPRPREAEKRALAEIGNIDRTHNVPRHYIFIERHVVNDHRLDANHPDFEQQILDHLAAWHRDDRRLQSIKKLVAQH